MTRPAGVPEEATRWGIGFDSALVVLKRGVRVGRAGWNGKGMSVYYVPPASYPANRGAMTEHFGADALVPYNAYLAIIGVGGTVSMWVPSVADLLADDWFVLG